MLWLLGKNVAEVIIVWTAPLLNFIILTKVSMKLSSKGSKAHFKKVSEKLFILIKTKNRQWCCNGLG